MMAGGRARTAPTSEASSPWSDRRPPSERATLTPAAFGLRPRDVARPRPRSQNRRAARACEPRTLAAGERIHAPDVGCRGPRRRRTARRRTSRTGRTAHVPNRSTSASGSGASTSAPWSARTSPTRARCRTSIRTTRGSVRHPRAVCDARAPYWNRELKARRHQATSRDIADVATAVGVAGTGSAILAATVHWRRARPIAAAHVAAPYARRLAHAPLGAAGEALRSARERSARHPRPRRFERRVAELLLP
jgi:hypothetical protein